MSVAFAACSLYTLVFGGGWLCFLFAGKRVGPICSLFGFIDNSSKYYKRVSGLNQRLSLAALRRMVCCVLSRR